MRLAVEVLSDRTLPSATLGSDGVLHVLGSEAGDTMRLSPGAKPGEVVLFGVPGVQDGTTFAGVHAVRVDDLAGPDAVRLDPLNLPPDANYSDAPDIIVAGGSGARST